MNGVLLRYCWPYLCYVNLSKAVNKNKIDTGKIYMWLLACCDAAAAAPYIDRWLFTGSSTTTDTMGADDSPLELNATLVEKFSRRLRFRTKNSEDQNPPLRMKLNEDIRKYVKLQSSQSHPEAWQNLPEFPSVEEVFDQGRKVYDQPVELEANTIVGPYFSKDSYLKKHYELLREDAISPLRDVIDEVQAAPFLLERDSRNDSQIYERVRCFLYEDA